MIKHIVLLKLSEDSIKQKNIIVERLNSLKDNIDFIRALEVGINFTDSPRAFDISLTVILDSKDDLERYAVHQYHLPILELLKSLNTESKVVDYEIAPKINSDEFGNATIIKKSNQYFDGQVTSRTVIDSDGKNKTLGVMMPGKYTFRTQSAEHMEILSGRVEVEVRGEEINKETIVGGEYFEVPANSSFDINVIDITDYCCTYID
ncbi:MAG: pyrimidine/purine nucleoside phosphorylase [Campylobacterota bacterium]|nr:pyrimidine/purine nucleoside phosphorylase [Campylobacterota bacterium]